MARFDARKLDIACDRSIYEVFGRCPGCWRQVLKLQSKVAGSSPNKPDQFLKTIDGPDPLSFAGLSKFICPGAGAARMVSRRLMKFRTVPAVGWASDSVHSKSGDLRRLCLKCEVHVALGRIGIVCEHLLDDGEVLAEDYLVEEAS